MNDQLSELRPSQRDALRLAGAVAFAAGIFVLLIRKGEDWADFPVLLVLAIPCVALYGLGIGAIRLGPADDAGADAPADRADRLPAWRATALVLGIIFVSLTLSQLVDTIGGDSGKSGWVFVIFLATAAAAAYAALVHRLHFAVLLAGLALIVSWIALWDALVDPSATTVRWLFVVIAALLAAGAFVLHRDNRREAPELVTAAGIAGLAAGVTALFAVAGTLISGAISSAFGGESDLSGGIQQGDEWDLFLLALALALIWYGARAAWRGPTYVGGAALFVFVLSAGTDVGALVTGDEPSTGLVGWPLLLIVIGGAALAAGLLGGGGPRSPDREEPAAAPAVDPAAPPDRDPPAGPVV